ncbi:restriction endonuclease subunit S [Micromonospora sp. NPDC053740]|uniref:restriction endonuclease subunit S n=1 Tax=Micromonospora sp. NPDC053740 TaxID=3155173 RepID=UPI0034266C15
MSEMILGDALEVLIDHRGKTPKKLGGDFTPTGVPVASAMLVKKGRLDLAGARRISPELYRRWMPVPTRRHDVILTSEAPLGECALVDTDEPLVLGQRLFGLRGKKGILDSRYLFYAFQFQRVRDDLHSRSSGTTVLGIRQSELLKIRIPAPEFPVQVAIAGLLGALDDKIAVNERIVSTVDTLALQKLEALLAGFSLNDGWREATLGSIAKVNGRKRASVPGGQLRYIDISSVSPGQVSWPELSSWDDAPGRARRGVSRGDVIWSTVRPNRRSHALILDDDPNLVASTGFAVMTPKGVGPAYLYGITTREEFVTYLESVAEGSAYPAVRAERFADAKVPLPPDDSLMAFEDTVILLRERAHQADIESRVLTRLRDALLPKLISGELRIKDAEQFLSDAV